MCPDDHRASPSIAGLPHTTGLLSGFCSSSPSFGLQLPSDSTSRWTPWPALAVPVITARRGLTPPTHITCLANKDKGLASPQVPLAQELAGAAYGEQEMGLGWRFCHRAGRGISHKRLCVKHLGVSPPRTPDIARSGAWHAPTSAQWRLPLGHPGPEGRDHRPGRRAARRDPLHNLKTRLSVCWWNQPHRVLGARAPARGVSRGCPAPRRPRRSEGLGRAAQSRRLGTPTNGVQAGHAFPNLLAVVGQGESESLNALSASFAKTSA